MRGGKGEVDWGELGGGVGNGMNRVWSMLGEVIGEEGEMSMGDLYEDVEEVGGGEGEMIGEIGLEEKK